MTDTNWKLIVAAFSQEDTTNQALATLKAAHEAKEVAFEDVAIVRRSEDGKLHIKDLGQMGFGRAAAIGGAIGAAIGILAGPAGVVVGGATGAWIGGVAAATTDTGIPDFELEQIGSVLKSGCSALVVFTRDDKAEAIEKLLVGAGSRLLTDSTVEGAKDVKIDCGGDDDSTS